jgi:nitrate reductase NapE
MDKAAISAVVTREQSESDADLRDPDPSKVDERRSFLFLTVVMVPVLTVVIVGGYGFMVWMYQLFAGPPSA